ncbi:wax ester/triacylglycerol synthase domain-containing protein [Cellulomonas soli]|uniref:diacylglycerol O-acyltransferase n=1 Tax=Cellulomonas soli TaxID=931535 RepID=A0A512PAU0_9CELL|nr:wax ester/triacylglycerol synthase domain-containing protein [Cellulomonas soli]NYI57396.1 hypothetical protein [Cellulomonas soli]GEP68324.1 diacylglycerol O-acyltransferase [Cellulomonas soli]
MTGERVGAGDLVEWLTDVGPAPKQVGALLVLGGSDIDVMDVERVLVERFGKLRRFGQRLEQSGRGRPRWVDAGAQSVAGQVSRLTCPAPGDQEALLAVATAALTRPLDRSGPLWRAEVVDGLAGGGVAVVLVLHHVLADGLGGLAVLSRLVDDSSEPVPAGGVVGAPGAPRGSGAPRPVVLPADASAVRVRRRVGAPRTSLNVPTGPRRVTVVVEADLATTKAAGRTRGATVNDVLLVVVAGAAGRLLRARGEDVDALVVSVAVATRAPDAAHGLGNHVGVMPVRVPLHGSAGDRLAAVTRQTRRHKGHARRTSTALVRPLFRLAVATGTYQRVIENQRLVNIFLTNMIGPTSPITFAGASVERLVPIVVGAGNVPTAFAALSYAGTLTVSVDVDPDAVPEVEALTAALNDELQEVLALAPPEPS